MQDELNDPRVRDTIEQAIARSFGAPHSFRITLAGADGADAPGNGPRASRHKPRPGQPPTPHRHRPRRPHPGGTIADSRRRRNPVRPPARSATTHRRPATRYDETAKMMRQAQQIQNRLTKAQEELEAMIVHGSAGGGVVRVSMTGKHEIISVIIEPEAAEDLETPARPGRRRRQRRLHPRPRNRRRKNGRPHRQNEHTRPALAPAFPHPRPSARPRPDGSGRGRFDSGRRCISGNPPRGEGRIRAKLPGSDSRHHSGANKIAPNPPPYPLDNLNIRPLPSNTDAATRPATRGNSAAPTAIRHNAPDADTRPAPKRTPRMPTRLSIRIAVRQFTNYPTSSQSPAIY